MSEDAGRTEVAVARGDIRSPAARALIDALNAELGSLYPEEGACHFRLDPDEVAGDRGAFPDRLPGR
jgi:hypothetical protein